MIRIRHTPLARIAPRDEYSRADVDAIARVFARAGTLRMTVNPHGLFPAVSATHAATERYQYVWIRDNIMIASYLAEMGRSDQAWRTVSAIGQYFAAHRERFDAVIRGTVDRTDPMMRPHVRFDGEALSELEEVWPHAQNDALGYFLWLACRLVDGGFDVPDATASVVSRFPPYFEAIEYWHDPDSGHWEEDVEVHNSSVGTVVAGLRELQRVLERPPHRSFHALADTSVVERLIEPGEARLASLPVESVSRPMDAAQLFLIYPLDVVTRAQADAILQNVTGPLRGDIGIRRYLGDSYWAPGYKTAFTEADRTRDFSRDLSARNRLIPGERKGQVEAEWCIFDPVVSVIYGRRYQASRDETDYALQVQYLNRTLAQITEHGQCPEAYYIEDPAAGRYVPNDHVPLAWTQANVGVALEYARRSGELRRRI